MSDNDSDLEPALVEALRNVPPADATTRERHLGTALAEFGLSQPRVHGRRSTRWLGVAAAGIMLVGAGYGLGAASGSDSRNGPAAEAGQVRAVDTTLPVKGSSGSMQSGNDGAAASASQPSQSPCNTVMSTQALTFASRYDTPQGWRVAYVRAAPAPAIVIVDESTCSVLQEIDLP